MQDKDVLLEVIHQKSNFDIQDYIGLTVLMIAFLECKDKDVLLEILRQKPDLNIQDQYKNTSTIYAFFLTVLKIFY